MALGTDSDSFKYDAGQQPTGYYIEVLEEDKVVSGQIDQNNIDISNYQSLVAQITPLKTMVEECKTNLDCCYNDACLGLVAEGVSFENINAYAQTMFDNATSLTTQLEDINQQILILKDLNQDLEKVKYKLVKKWVPY